MAGLHGRWDARTAVVAVALASFIAGALPTARVAVRVHVRDASTGDTVAARVYLRHGAEPLLPSGLVGYDRGAERHVLVSGAFDLDLDPAVYHLRLERGLEYEPVDLDVEAPRTAPVEVALRRWADMNREGWYSADMHVHRDPADVPLVLEAEDLNFVPTITTHVWSDQENRPWKSPVDFPVVVSPTRVFTATAQEIERIQGGPGAVILLDRDLPLPFTGYEMYPPSATFARIVHGRGGFVEGDKPFWVDTFVNAALGHIDAVELNCNHFLPRSVDTDLAPWSHWPIEFGYRGARGFALWMMDLYYRMLNAGIELPLSAGSASGVKETPVGFDRVYAHLGRQAFGYGAFMSALKEGRTFTTNGPLLELEVDGRYGPGDRIRVQPGHEYRVRAHARWREPLERLELVVNGAVAAERAAEGDDKELSLEKAIAVRSSTWVAVRAFGRAPTRESWQPGPQIFAHTSPVYLLVGGVPVVVSESVRDLVQKLDTLIARTTSDRGFRQASEREETLALYGAARAVLVGRLGSTP